MIWFLLKGLVRDRHRSLFPIIVVAAGVMVTVLIHAWVKGAVGDISSTNARMDTGHVKIMTRAYREIASQIPNDLALFGVSDLLEKLKREYPDVNWAPRIKFGGLLDIPDENGETRAQGPVFGMGLALFSPDSHERERLNMQDALVSGRLPQSEGEIVISDQFAHNLGVKLNETATLVSATANGSMAIYNFIVVGTIKFGVAAMDKSAMLADISDIQYALDMADGAGEILGFLPNNQFDRRKTDRLAADFNAKFGSPTPGPSQEGNKHPPGPSQEGNEHPPGPSQEGNEHPPGPPQGGDNEFAPVMITLRDQNGLGAYLDMVNAWIFAYVAGFVGVMSIVLWNTGLMSGIRRYGEMGIRLAIGEHKGHVYRTLIYESVLVGLIGSVLGTLIGLGFAYLLQTYGIDVSDMFEGGSMLVSNVIRARITPAAYYIGFIPGLAATTLGAMMSGTGIFKRQTSQLFKELEA